MNTLFAKILLWFWATLIITTVGSAWIYAVAISSGRHNYPPVARLVTFDLREARAAYESGGHDGLAQFMQRFHSVFSAEAIFTDASGRDLLTGADESALFAKVRSESHLPILRRGGTVVARGSDDRKYWFFLVLPKDRVTSWFLLPEHLWGMGVGIALCYLLAYYLTYPVRKLERAVERFGRGDFSARAGSSRRDELGELASTFDRMADRIQTLVHAERRLLLDISHELRSPLARLRVAVELARAGESREMALNRIDREAERLNSLIGGLLQVTRAEGDPGTLRRERVELDRLLDEIVGDSAIEAQARASDVRMIAAPPVVVEGDPELLRRAIENVIRNAIRYAPAGTAVEVSLEQAPGKAVVDIRDHGPGVPEQALPRIFDPFYRVETDRDRASGGVGLGLSIARRAVELHKGQIRARNADPGLLVEIELPAAA